MSRKIPIEKLPVHGIEGMTHCWAPVVNGKVVEHVDPDTGKTEPCRSVRGAKRAVARHLNCEVVEEIDFDMRR